MGGLIGIEYLAVAFNSMKMNAVQKNDVFKIGKVCGLFVMRVGSISSVPVLLLIDNWSKTVTTIKDLIGYSNICEFVFEGTKNDTEVSIKHISSTAGYYWIAYQTLGFG